MKEHILELLFYIEKEYEVKILYACEAGSRTWGISSEESDYDVRFIYIHKSDWYLSIDQKRDVLEIPKRDKIRVPINPLVDMSGWEVTKVLRLYRKSNPTLLEWLHSNIIYYQDDPFITRMKQLEETVFSPIPCIYHYLKMAKGNYKTIQENGPELKIYLNIIRPLLMASSIKRFHRMGILDLNQLVRDFLPKNDVQKSIDQLIKVKSDGQKLTQEPIAIHTFIENEIQQLEHYVSNLHTDSSNPTLLLDQLFRSTLEDAWK